MNVTTNRLAGIVCSRCQYRSESPAEQTKFTRFTLRDQSPSRPAILCPRCTEKLLRQLHEFLSSYTPPPAFWRDGRSVR
ncbi:hypothetical protein [Solimonas variicoloris]|uniref:hypothetical protein n=1 Tax=Solimonas variicoloris TaxID=254408 RepID=UPI000370C769|nr:hypothetical protein [Solimonas variicoloris]